MNNFLVKVSINLWDEVEVTYSCYIVGCKYLGDTRKVTVKGFGEDSLQLSTLETSTPFTIREDHTYVLIIVLKSYV